MISQHHQSKNRAAARRLARMAPWCLAASLLPQVAQAQDRVLSWEAEYVADGVVLAEGEQTGAHMLGLADLQAELSLANAFDWTGTKIVAHGQWTHGGRPNDKAGTLQGIDNIEVAAGRLRMFELFMEHEAQAGDGSMKLGFFDLNSEFYVTDSSLLLLAPPFGIGSELAATGSNGPSIFPSSAAGVRLRLTKPGGSYAMLAVLNADAGVWGDAGGVRPLLANGALVIAEAGLERAGQNKLGLGGWTYTRRQDDLRETDASGTPAKRQAWGIYALAEKRVLGGEDRNLTLFARIGFSDGRTSPHKAGWQAGLTAQAPIHGRQNSQLSLGFHQAVLSTGFRANAIDTGLAVGRRETGVELTYADQIAPWLTVQPDVQYLRNGLRGTRARDTVTLSVRLRFALPH